MYLKFFWLLLWDFYKIRCISILFIMSGIKNFYLNLAVADIYL